MMWLCQRHVTHLLFMNGGIGCRIRLDRLCHAQELHEPAPARQPLQSGVEESTETRPSFALPHAFASGFVRSFTRRSESRVSGWSLPRIFALPA